MRRIDCRKLTGWAILALGLLSLLDNFIGFDFWSIIWKLWPLILILLGLYILVGRGQFGSDSSAENKFIGDLKINYAGRQIGDSRSSIFMGELSIDLAGSVLRNGLNRLEISFGMGDVDISVPRDFIIRVTARSIAGDLKYDSQKSEGFFPKLEYSDDGYESSERKLHIDVSGLFGELSVRKIPG